MRKGIRTKFSEGGGSPSVKRSSFELLRILAMYGIIIFHHFGNKTMNCFVELPKGFSADNYFYDIVNNSTGSLELVTLVMDFCYGHFGDGGNFLFMMITGYFLFGKTLSLEKRIKPLLKTLFIVFFWGCVITVIYAVAIKFFYPFAGVTSYKPMFEFPNWFSGANMWYFQAYGVFLLIIMPILKYFEPRLDRKTHKLVMLMFIALLFLDYTAYLPSIWLSKRLLQFTACYYIGGYIAKYPVSCSIKKLVLALIAYISLSLLYLYYWRLGMRRMHGMSGYSYIKVINPVFCCLVFAVLVFLIFSKINFQSNIVNHIAKATPGIYVFHFKTVSLSFAFAEYWWHDWSPQGYFSFILLNSMLLFVVGYMIDQFRQRAYTRLQKQSL